MARILSIEDDADIQRLIGQALFRENYEVNYAWNGKEGYEKILSFDPDLILLDLMLPLMNGVELLKKLQDEKITPEIPVVVISAYGDEVNLLGHSVKALGAAGYLRKPVNLQEMVVIIKNILLQFPRTPSSKGDAKERGLSKGAVRADPKFKTVWINDKLVATLSPKRFDLLLCLIESSGSVPREALLKKMGYKARQVNAIKQDIHRLREDLGPSEQRRIQTTLDGYELIG